MRAPADPAGIGRHGRFRRLCDRCLLRLSGFGRSFFTRHTFTDHISGPVAIAVAFAEIIIAAFRYLGRCRRIFRFGSGPFAKITRCAIQLKHTACCNECRNGPRNNRTAQHEAANAARFSFRCSLATACFSRCRFFLFGGLCPACHALVSSLVCWVVLPIW